MRIASVEVVPYALPFREPYVTAAGTLTRREMALLRLRSDDGLAALGLSAPARCAALTALLDLRGRRAALETGESGEGTAPVRCNATLVSGGPAAVVSAAERWADDGFTSFKLKLGTGDDVAQVRAVRDAVGPAACIRVDVNGSWDLETAKQ